MTTSFRQSLRASAERHAARPALWVDGQTLSYAELFERAQALADRIDQRIAPGGALGIYCQRDIPSLTGVLAAVLSGRSYLPLNPTLPEDRLRAVLRLAGPRAIICAPETAAAGVRMAEADSQGIRVFDAEGVQLSADTGTPTIREEDGRQTLYTMFTSGTTGEPKGVRILDSNVEAYLQGIDPITQLTEHDRTSHFFDLSFDLSVHDIFVTFMAGAQLNILPAARNMAIVDFVAERALTSWFSVPSLAAFCNRLGQLREGALGSLRTALFCGEPLAVSLARSFHAAAPNARLWNIYGPTEATIAFTAYELQRPDGLGDMAVVPLGWPIGEQRCAIDGTEAGELQLGGSQVTPGYTNSPEMNETRFFDAEDGTRFYRTGDLATYSDAHGYLFNGRIDDQVKLNGYRVELLEIDAVLREVAGTPEVAAIAWPPPSTGQTDHVVAFVTSPTASPADIRKACRARLPSYMIPRKVVTLEQMPVSPSGKIDRKALARLLAED